MTRVQGFHYNRYLCMVCTFDHDVLLRIGHNLKKCMAVIKYFKSEVLSSGLNIVVQSRKLFHTVGPSTDKDVGKPL